MQTVKKSAYRQRVYQLEDGSIILVFGNDPAPENAKLLADHDVSDVTIVTDHIEQSS